MATGVTNPFVTLSNSVTTENPGGPHSPSKNQPPKRTTAAELLEQIRQLEIEGNKLRSSSLASLDPSLSSPDKAGKPGLSEQVNGSRIPFPTPSPSALSALVDISAEQKTISDLRTQLESQRKETERLQYQLLHDYSSSRNGPIQSAIPSSPSKTGFSTLPSTELFSARRPTFESGPPSHLEKSLKDSQEQVAELRRRLQESLEDVEENKENVDTSVQYPNIFSLQLALRAYQKHHDISIAANDLHEQQKRHFRNTIEELKSKLHETVANRDTVLDLRLKEAANQESLVSKLQGQVQQLNDRCKAQEDALSDAARKMEENKREKYVSDTALNQVRLMLSDAEKRRGKPFFDSDPASKQSPSMLVHTMERCLQELSSDFDLKNQKLVEIEKENLSLRQTLSKSKEDLGKEQLEKCSSPLDSTWPLRITSMSSEHQRQMQAATDRANNAQKQVVVLQSQIAMMEGQFEQQLKMKDVAITDLQQKVGHLREETEEEKHKWSKKKESLESQVERLHKDLISLRHERDEAIRNHAALESKLEDLQATTGSVRTEVELERQKNRQLLEKEDSLRARQTDLESKSQEKQREIERLEKMLDLVKHDCNVQINEKISYAERQERDRHLEQISSLTTQLSTMTDKCNRLSLELEVSKSEHSTIKKQLHDTTDQLEAIKIQQTSLSAEKAHANNMLTDKKSELERLRQEKEYYANLLEQKSDELAQVRTQKERITIQLEEKEKNLMMMQQHSNSFSQMMENNTRSLETLREEKDKLARIVAEQTATLADVKTMKENMSKKMKIREKRIRDLEEEKAKWSEELQVKQEEMGIVQKEKDVLYKELKESRYEVASLSEQRDSYKQNLEKQRLESEREIHKLQSKLKAAEQDLRQAQKTLRSRESADHQAVKVADKMQKEVTSKRSEVDSLRTKVRWLEDKLETINRERSSLESDKDRLKQSLNKSLTHNQQITADLEVAQGRIMDLRNQISRQEMALEKANTKNATSQAQLEQFEQEITCMKLKHQLDLQEAIQKSSTTPVEPIVTKNPSIPSVQPMKISYPQDVLLPKSATRESSKSRNKMSSSKQIPTRDTDDYKEELKSLLHEMRSLLAEKKLSDAKNVPHHQRYRPVQSNLPRGQYSLYSTSSETEEYFSDAEVDRSILYRSRSKHRTNVSGTSAARASRSRSLSPISDFPRRHSIEGPSRLSGNSSVVIKHLGKDGDLSRASSRHYSYSNEDINKVAQIAEDPPASSMRLMTGTQDLCRRLEQRIESLSKMGGSMQKENKEMADLMKQQGKKLKKVKETQKRIRKTAR